MKFKKLFACLPVATLIGCGSGGGDSWSNGGNITPTPQIESLTQVQVNINQISQTGEVLNTGSADLSKYGVGIATIEQVFTNPNNLSVTIQPKLGYGLATSGAVDGLNGIYSLAASYPNQCVYNQNTYGYEIPANGSCSIRYALTDIQAAACDNLQQTKCTPISSATLYTSYGLTKSGTNVSCSYGYEINPTTKALTTVYSCARSYAPTIPTVLQYGVADYKTPVTPYPAIWTQIPDSPAAYGAANASGSLIAATAVAIGTYGHSSYTSQWNNVTNTVDYQTYFTSTGAAVGAITNDGSYGFTARSIGGYYSTTEWNWTTGLNDNYNVLACNSCQPQVINPNLDTGLIIGKNGVIYTQKTQYQFNEVTNTFIPNSNLLNPTETSWLRAVDSQGNAISYGINSKSFYCSNVNTSNSMRLMGNASGMDSLSDFAVLANGGIYEPKVYTPSELTGGVNQYTAIGWYKVNFNTCEVENTPSYITSGKNGYMAAQTPTYSAFAYDGGSSADHETNHYYAIPNTSFVMGYVY